MSLKSHLLQRRLVPSLYRGLAIDDAEGVVVFPLWNLSGQMVGFQQYRPDADKAGSRRPSLNRYFTYLSKQVGSPAVTAFGLDLLGRYESRVLYVVEGVFDAAPLHKAGLNAIATLSNNPRHLKRWIASLGYHTVALCEGDAAGAKLAAVANEAIWLPEGLDPGDMPDSWVWSLPN